MIPKVVPAPTAVPDREQDNFGWLTVQADLARRGRTDLLDLEGIAAEFEELMGDKVQELESRLTILYQHLLKYQFQLGRRSGSWVASILEQRQRIGRMIAHGPGLKPSLIAALATEEFYLDGRDRALAEFSAAGVEINLPDTNPYRPDQVLDPHYWPGPGPHPVLSDRQRAKLRLPPAS